jgi:peptidyl-dipeptidase A
MKKSISSLALCLGLGLSGLSAADTAKTAADANKFSSTAEANSSPVTVAEAKSFIAQVDKDLRRLLVKQSKADWAKQTNITAATEAAAAVANSEYLSYSTKIIQASARFLPIMDQLDKDTRRQIELIRFSATLTAPLDPAKSNELARITTSMDAEYGKAKVCDAKGKNCQSLGDLEDILAKSRNQKELLEAWSGWHNTIGKTIKNDYQRFVELGNEGARGIGFADMGEQWRSGYDMAPADFEKEVDRLWGQVEPLYKDLHCYARQKLSEKYGSKLVSKSGGGLPAHLVGNMWAQDWNYVYPELQPYQGQPEVNVTPALLKQNYTPERMVKLAESFFTSIGLNPLPASFWERSMFVKPEGKEVVCHASAWDPEYAGDVRIKMCIKINQEDLTTIHHELGHDYYFLSYFDKPMLYQSGANDGFHEAIGDAIALSMTPDYLKKVGLLESTADNEKALINSQMQKALDKVAFLPWGLLVDKWRWDVFSGKVAAKDWNQHWWDLRLKYQGVTPPTDRPADAFDPGAKYHVAGNTPYMRYFLADILQFQFHRALCETAGHKGPLNTCSIYGNKKAGEKLRKMMEMGASQPWPEALAQITGKKTMDASAMIDYFAPLQAWLKKQNKSQNCGWDNPTAMPVKTH